jgi:hypothetical protein
MGAPDAVPALVLVRCSYAIEKTADNAELVVRVLRIQALAPGAGLLPSFALLHALYHPPVPCGHFRVPPAPSVPAGDD